MPTKRFDSLEPDRKQALLSAAAAEFAAHGYGGASYNAIIERAGTSKGAMYYYFEDKADLYATVVRDAIERFVGAWGSLGPIDDEASFWDEMRRKIAESLRHYRVDPHLPGLIRSLAHDGLSVAPVAEIRSMSTAFFANLTRIGQQVGAVRTDLPLDLVLGIAIAISEAFDLWLADRVTELSDAEIESLSDTMVDAYRRLAQPPEDP